MKLLVLSCLAALAFNSGAEDKVNLCGSELARARVMLCYGAEYLFKRSANGLFDSKEYEDHSFGRAVWPWHRRRFFHATRRARNKRGLVDECCVNACTTDTILSYCD